MSNPPDWNRIHELFSEMLELDPVPRDAHLSELALLEPELVREVRSLLAANERAGSFLDEPPPDGLLSSVSPGDRLGPWQLESEIGRGGMGVVFRATRYDDDFVHVAAIKVIYPGLRSDDIRRRFRAERQILAMLDHPNIARLIDGGTAPDGTPWLAMDYVSGEPLLQYCDHRRLTVDERLRLMLPICEAVQFAHQRLVIHRDLKPDNILVTEDGAPKLLDFGIARLLQPDAEGLPATVTVAAQRLMTPDYASPEQVRGEPVTVAGDVYSLGVILYELLSGSRPFRFTTRSPEEYRRVITDTDPVPPSTALTRAPTGEAAACRSDTPLRLRRRLAGDLDYIALKALEKDPTRRYGSVLQFGQDIRRHLEGEPILARGQSQMYRLSRFVRRNRAAVTAGALVALSLVAGLAGTAWQAGVAGRQRDRANRRFDEVRNLAHVVIFDIHDAIANLPGSTAARETLVQHALKYLDGLSSDTAADHALQREIAVAYVKIGDVQGRPMFSNLGRTAEARQSYEKALAILHDVAKAQPESLAVSHAIIVATQRLADLLNLNGQPAEAMKLAVEARERILVERARHPDDHELENDLVVAHDRIGGMKLAGGDSAGAIAERLACSKMADEIFRRDPKNPESRRSALMNHSKDGELLAMQGRREEAMRSYRQAELLALEAVRSLGNDTQARRDLSIVQGMIGLFLADEGKIDSALAVYGQAQHIAEVLFAEDPDNSLQKMDVAAGHHEIGTILARGRRHEAAVDRYGRSFELFADIAAADTANADSRVFMARSGRRAGEECYAMARASTDPTVRSRWRARALAWLDRALPIYGELQRTGALTGNETRAPEEIRAMMAGLR